MTELGTEPGTVARAPRTGAARAAQPRDPSPCRELTARADLVRRFCRHLGRAHGVPVSMVLRPTAGVWAVTWTPHADQLVPPSRTPSTFSTIT